MKRSKEFNDILNDILEECLERVLARGETIERCLADYPELADELRPLLETVLTVNKAADIKPRPEFRERARYQFRRAIEEKEAKKTRRFFWQPRWATVGIAVLVFLVAGSSTVMAAGNSMPDEPLYPVKLATEAVREKLTPSLLGKADLYVDLADKRVSEIVYLAGKGNPGQVERTTERLNGYIDKITSLALGGDMKSGRIPAPRVAAQAPVPAPAPAQTAVPAPTRAPTPTPSPAPAPPVIVQAPPAAAPTTLAPSTTEAMGVKAADRQPMTQKEKMRQKVAQFAVNHPEALRRAMEKARDESVKSALRKAIESSEKEYDKALKSLN